MDEPDEVVISVSGVSKNFVLPHEKVGSIKSIFTNLFSYVSSQRSYETQKALQDISFEIKKGEFFGIVGRNGSGKSTLLKMLAGIYQPTAGQIGVTGRLVPFIELGVGFSPELTGKQNVYLNGALLGFSEKEIDAQYAEIVKFAELEKFMDQKLKNYSSGMQVRLAFSMAIRAEADILLVDEVLAVGDADFQRKCFDYFRSLKKNKKTVVFVSHNMAAIREYCDRAAFIEKSQLVSVDTADHIATLYTQMFSNDPATDHHDNSSRWGKQMGLIKTVDAPKKVNSSMKEIVIKLAIKAKTDLPNPMIGYSIKNSDDQSIVGSNTKIDGIETEDYKAGQTINVEWAIPNIFSDGSYYIDLAVLKNDGVTVLDWWDSAAGFTVYEDRPSPFLVSPNVKVTIQSSKK